MENCTEKQQQSKHNNDNKETKIHDHNKKKRTQNHKRMKEREEIEWSEEIKTLKAHKLAASHLFTFHSYTLLFIRYTLLETY